VKRRLFIFLGLLFIIRLAAQEGDSLNWDIDTIFDEPLQGSPEEQTKTETADGKADGKADGTFTDKVTDMVGQLIPQRGFLFEAGFEFNAGLAPGWLHPPWNSNGEANKFYLNRYIKMLGLLTLDAQISRDFRVRSTVKYQIPDFVFLLGDFFFDYKIYDTFFFRGGKYNLTWGISPNFGFTNLLARIPRDGNIGESYIFKAEMPIGKGGIQVLTLTRFDLIQGSEYPDIKDFGFGGKYNLALTQIDLDAGVFYQDGMPLRSFISAKTTLWGNELYGEALLAIDLEEPSNISGAGNIGIGRDFFDGKFNVNGELYYNAEKDSFRYQPETNIREEGESPFIDGFNLALNLLYKPWEKGNPRVYLGTLFAPGQNSAQIIPAFRLSPWNNLELYFAAPLSLGSREGYYYKNTVTIAKDNSPLPFSLIFLVTLKGSIRYGRNF